MVRCAIPERLTSGWPGALLLTLIAFVAMGGIVRNAWVQDEPALLQLNPKVHSWSGLVSGFHEPFWPRPATGGLYRPVTRTLHTLEWIPGGGSSLPFRLTDLVLYVALVLTVWTLARELLTATQAWLAAALFAAHPVHVEAVALAVDQGELVVGIATALAVALWLRARKRGAISTGSVIALVALYLVALGAKENGALLPLFLIAIELLFPAPAVIPSRRWGVIASLLLLGAGWWALRTAVLGDLTGAPPADALEGAGIGTRALTMLGIAGEWTRLLFWPLHLKGDYAPWETAPWDHWRSEQTAGLLALLAFGIALALAWRRRPALAFALLWVALGLAPVSNVIVPTGITLAERTLLVASIGIVIGVASLVPDRVWSSRWRWGAWGGTLLIVGAGVARSAVRTRDYHDPVTYMAALRRDAPKSWRVLTGAGTVAFESGRIAEGTQLLLQANAAWPSSPRPLLTLALLERAIGRCDVAIPILEQMIVRTPAAQWIRVPLVSCLLDLGRYAEAGATAARGSGDDPIGVTLRAAVPIAQNALRANAPMHTVRLPPVPGGLVMIGDR